MVRSFLFVCFLVISMVYSFTNCSISKVEYSLSLDISILPHLPKPRIFLLGDSIIGQICRELMCVPNVMKVMQPKVAVPKATWYLLREQAIKSSQGELAKAYHLAYFGRNVSVFSNELYKGYHPSPADIMIILVGAHFHHEEPFRHFVKGLYREVALPFPGAVYWIEPLPEHWKRGRFSSPPPPLSDCFPWTQEGNMTQLWRKQTIRDIVRESANVTVVQAYDSLAPLWNCHKHTSLTKKLEYRDCTHYLKDAYAIVVHELSLLFAQAKKL